MRFFAITALLTALTAASPIVENVERGGYYPDPKTVTIKGTSSWPSSRVKAIGSGCPPGSFEKSLDDTKTTLTLAFSKYTVQTGKNIEPKEARKNCNVYLILDYPAGWSYTVSTSYLRGYADLDKTCKASVGAKYFWSGYPGSGNCKADIWGEKHDYDFDLEAKAAALVWSQCGKKGKGGPPFNINTSINVDCKDAYKSASAGIDSQDTKFEMKFPLTWKKC